MGGLGFFDSGLTTRELIQELRAAIRAVAVGGQSYKIGSRTLTRANLTELKNALAYFKDELAAEDTGPLAGAFLVDFLPR